MKDGKFAIMMGFSKARITIKLDRLITLSKSSLLSDIDNQGEVPKGSIIDRDNQGSFILMRS
jgi:hypothetical protein